MTRDTIYDINPEPKKKWYKIDSMIECAKCKKMANGYIILDRMTLKVIDTSGFMIFDEPLCDLCCEGDRNNFNNLIEDVCKELGTTPTDLGIALERDKEK
ncbi:MAG: hypothetical protein ACXWFZ_10455 [Nitrososphaeraceae archaeon]